jgi:cellobiose phosphorylase
VLPPNLSARDPNRYANEPYAFTSWIYGPEHACFGNGQLSWLTGGVAWIYLVGLQYILGIKPALDGLRIDPCIPRAWPGYDCQRRWRGTLYRITVENPKHVGKGDVALTLDGQPLSGNVLPPVAKAEVAVRAVLQPQRGAQPVLEAAVR